MMGTEFVSRAPTLLTAPLFVGLLLFVSVVIGRRVLHLFGAVRSASPGERLVVAVAIGLGALQFGPFVLGLFGLLSPTSVRIMLAVLGVIALVDLLPLVATARCWWSGRRRLAAWEWVWLALLAAPLVFSFFVALAPSFDPDGLGYHLTAPKRWLQIGSLDYLPTLTYTNGPMGSEMLYSIALGVVGDSGAKLIHFAASLLAAVGIYLLGSRVRSPMVGRIACTLFLFGPFGVYGIIGFGYVEGTATLAIVASMVCWMLWFDTADRAWLRPAALLAGLAVSFKLTSLLFPVALLALTILVVRSRGRRETGVDDLGPKGIAGLMALVVAPIAPWLVRSLVVTGNPVFPLLARWIPSRDFPAAMSNDFETYNRYMLWGNRWGYRLSIDTRRLILVAIGLGVLIVGALVYRRLRDPLHRAVTLVVVSIVLVQLAAAGLYARYWIPLAAVVLIPVIALVISRINPRVVRAGLLVITFLFAARELGADIRGKPVDLVLASVSQDRSRRRTSRPVPLRARACGGERRRRAGRDGTDDLQLQWLLHRWSVGVHRVPPGLAAVVELGGFQPRSRRARNHERRRADHVGDRWAASRRRQRRGFGGFPGPRRHLRDGESATSGAGRAADIGRRRGRVSTPSAFAGRRRAVTPRRNQRLSICPEPSAWATVSAMLSAADFPCVPVRRWMMRLSGRTGEGRSL